MGIEYDNREFIQILFSLEGSVIPLTIVPAIITLIISIIAMVIYFLFGYFVEVTGHNMVGFVLGFLLIFRTDLSVKKYEEGQRAFRMIDSNICSMFNEICGYYHGDSEEDYKNRLQFRRYFMILRGLIRQHIRDETNLKEISVLTREERRLLRPHQERPRVVMQWIFKLYNKCWDQEKFKDDNFYSVDEALNEISRNRTECIRIKTSPLPFPYAQITTIFLFVYLLSLPFALSQVLGWYSPIVCPLITMAFWGINEVALEIEDPFGDDPNDLDLQDWEYELDRELGGFHSVRDPQAPLFLMPENAEEEEEDAKDSKDSKDGSGSKEKERRGAKEDLTVTEKYMAPEESIEDQSQIIGL